MGSLILRHLRLAASIGGTCALLLLIGSCDSQNIYNSQSEQQATDEANARIAQLQPALGSYCGSVHFIPNNQDYDASLNLQIVEQNEHSTTSQDPTDTVRVPMLGGSMVFPAIKNDGSAAYSELPELIQATGEAGSVSFSYGDYNPLDHSINLPFSQSGAATTTTYGSVQGNLSGDTITGQWYSDSSQLVGTFTFSRCSPDGSS